MLVVEDVCGMSESERGEGLVLFHVIVVDADTECL